MQPAPRDLSTLPTAGQIAPSGAEAATLPPASDPSSAEAATLPPTPPGVAATSSAADPVALAVTGYEILGVLGKGGMGVVYKARQVGLNRIVALKMILHAEHAGPDERQRFKAEAEAVARLQHPHIVQVFEVGEHNGLPFFSLEFCGGGSLADKLDGTPLPPAEAAKVVEKLARAMQVAHKADIIHRDLKPANVLLADDGTAKVTDFGLAKRLDMAGQTQTGAVMGTPSYMAPEQAGGKSKDMGPAADVYALGAILYELLCGRPPFRAATALDTVLQVVSEEPVPVRQLQPKTPRDLETICLKCLHKDPKKRYATAEALAEDLRRYQAGEPITARPAGRLERALKWAKRRPAVAGLLAVAVVAAASLLTLGLWFTLRLTEERDRAQQHAAQEVKAHAETLTEKAKAEKQLLRSEWLLYANQIAFAQREWKDNEVGHARELLDACRSDFRGWEYAYLRYLVDGSHVTFRGNAISNVCFSPDGRRLAWGSGGYGQKDGKPWGGVKVWDAATGKEFLALKGHTTSLVGSVCFSPDGKRLASGGGEWNKSGEVKVWDATTGREGLTLKGHNGFVQSVCFSPDGKRLASGSGGWGYGPKADKSWGEVKVWDAATGQDLLTLTGHTERVTSVCFSPDGKRLASASDDKTVKLWDAATGQDLLTLKGHTHYVRSVSFSPEGERLVSASADATVKVWDAHTRQEGLTFKAHSTGFLKGCLSPDGKRLASGGFDKEVKVWDVATGHEFLTLKGHTWEVTSVCFSPDGKHLASASGQYDVKTSKSLGEVRVWDAATGKAIRTLTGLPFVASGLCFSPDGKRLASGSITIQLDAPDEVRVWDVDTGQEILTLKARHIGPVRSLCFSPDGQRLASAGVDKTVKVYAAATGQHLLTLKGHTGEVTSVCFSPDGRRLASGSDDRTVKVWESTMGQELLTLKGYRASVISLAFSPDGKRLTSAINDGTVSVRGAVSAQEREYRLHTWHEQQGREAEQQRQWFAAAFHLSQLLRLGPPQAPLYARRGIARLELGHIEPAAADFAAVLRIDPNDAAAWRGQLRTCLLAPRTIADWMPVIRRAEQAAAANKTDPLAARTLGGVLLRAGRYPQAVAELQRALSLRPADVPAHEELLLALAYHHQGQPAEARRWLERATAWRERGQGPVRAAALAAASAGSPLATLPLVGGEVTDPRRKRLGSTAWLEFDLLAREAGIVLKGSKP